MYSAATTAKTASAVSKDDFIVDKKRARPDHAAVDFTGVLLARLSGGRAEGSIRQLPARSKVSWSRYSRETPLFW